MEINTSECKISLNDEANYKIGLNELKSEIKLKNRKPYSIKKIIIIQKQIKGFLARQLLGLKYLNKSINSNKKMAAKCVLVGNFIYVIGIFYDKINNQLVINLLRKRPDESCKPINVKFILINLYKFKY